MSPCGCNRKVKDKIKDKDIKRRLEKLEKLKRKKRKNK
jgi:hypothetical protein